MTMKNNKILKVSAMAAVLSIGILSGGYTLANKDITLVVNGKESEISTLKSNVKDILDEQNVKYDKNDIVSLPLDQKVVNGDKIEVIDVTEKTVKEDKDIPFEVNIVEDSNLLKGQTKVEVEGQQGKNELVYKVTYHNGKQVEKEFMEEIVATEPIDKLVKKGTKVEVQVASSRGENTRATTTLSNKVSSNSTSSNASSNRKHLSVVATAYTGHSVTATGTTPRWGTIAVDPSIIPYGTKVYIPQFDKTFIAEDCGSAIKGNKIDIYMNDESSVYSWGRKTIDIYIVK